MVVLSREEKLEKDELRTAIHNTVIRNLSILKRMVENRNENIEWYNRFYDDRKELEILLVILVIFMLFVRGKYNKLEHIIIKSLFY